VGLRLAVDDDGHPTPLVPDELDVGDPGHRATAVGGTGPAVRRFMIGHSVGT
jgi:hypothetical protein